MASPEKTPLKSNRENASVQQPDGSDGEQSALLEQHSYRRHKRASMTFRQVQRVSKRAALVSKRKIWDSNDASIDAAQTAVDHWENTYAALRGLLVASSHSAQRLYGAAKTGANGLEHGLLVPVRDWILLPTFWGVERVAGETVCFLQSPQAAQVANASLDVVKSVPFVGDNVLAPALVQGVELAKAAWQVAQYPIPSKEAVRDSVDFVMTGTKWALTTAGREVYFYAQIVDANITRTLMHTQWKVLGSGPYATLDKINKGEVIDHLCERYFSLGDTVHRYELAAHIRAHNPILYQDLVLTGVLRKRGGDLTANDEWLARYPTYRLREAPFLLPKTNLDGDGLSKVAPLWFRLPYQNGKRPGKDVPWVRLTEGNRIEQRYLSFLAGASGVDFAGDQNVEYANSAAESSTPRYTTIAQWYEPDMERDILVDEKRHALSFLLCCPKCRAAHGDWRPPLVPVKLGSLCKYCKEVAEDSKPSTDSRFLPPPVRMIMRPTLWRFHGPGDEVRRAVWFLDTQRHGLQPYSEDSAAVLEDAYLFLKWRISNQSPQDQKASLDLHGELLTVEVSSPNGAETQLVQFRSLTQVTAIQKTLGGAVSLFKRRVYRGVAPEPASSEAESPETENPPVEGHENFSVVKVEGFSEERQTDAATIESDCLDPNTSLAISSSKVSREAEEENPVCGEDDDIDHLVLIVHGIGEMLRSIDLFGRLLPTLSSIVDCCRFLRTNHAQIHASHSTEARRLLKESMRGRVEYLPVEWHEAFALQSQRQPAADAPSPVLEKPLRSSNTTMSDISLRTIPQMRAFANDTLLDVLYFMSPEHHTKMIDIVTSEMNLVVEKFRSLTGFNGNISVIGHSLGSVIAWDILAHQIPDSGVPKTYEPPSLSVLSPSSLSSQSLSSFSQKPTPRSPRPDDESSAQLSDSDSVTPEDTEPEVVGSHQSTYPQLEFEVQNAFMLGSPIPVFLMIRNQHQPLNENFYLSGCRRVFNIFHPYDPVAYRMEPLLDPRNADIEPRIITHWNGGFRVHYQTKLLWKKLVDETWKTQQNVINAVERRMAGLGLLDGGNDVMFDDEEELSELSSDETRLEYVNCGKLNQGARIDYMLQEKEIENANEYVAALAAHSSYWSEKDFSLFIARQIYRARNEEIQRFSSPSRQATTPANRVDL